MKSVSKSQVLVDRTFVVSVRLVEASVQIFSPDPTSLAETRLLLPPPLNYFILFR